MSIVFRGPHFITPYIDPTYEDMMADIISKQMKATNDTLEKYCRMFAAPKIKGEFTKGKMNWRGLRLVKQNLGLEGDRLWIEQRGKRITPIIENGKVILSSLRRLTIQQSGEDVDKQLQDLRNEWDREPLNNPL